MAARILVGLVAALRATLIPGEAASALEWTPSLPRLRRPRIARPRVAQDLQPAKS
jgi:hypothetical protein